MLRRDKNVDVEKNYAANSNSRTEHEMAMRKTGIGKSITTKQNGIGAAREQNGIRSTLEQ
jgi:hypothetical protein